jgi:hypothetical protein
MHWGAFYFLAKEVRGRRYEIQVLLTSYVLLPTSLKEGAMRTQRLFVDKPTAILEGYSAWINE